MDSGNLKLCNQCGKPAVVVAGGNPLCVDCSLKMQQAFDLENARYAREMNSLLGHAEDIVGLPGIFQRHQIPTPTMTINTGATNHIRVNHSVVGAINTGDIKKLDVVMDHITAGGNGASADDLKKLVQAVVDNSEIQLTTKNEILEHLAFISAQAILPKAARQNSVVRLSLNAAEKLLSTSADLLSIWMVVKPHIVAF